jgi:hypothetical protein
VNLSDFSIKSPYTVIAVSLLIAALGVFAYFRTPTNLFPTRCRHKSLSSQCGLEPTPMTLPTR